MQNKKNMQDFLLNKIRLGKQNAVIFLTNGFRLTGTIEAFDNFIIVLRADDKQQIIYKHAISTIIPSKNINIADNTPSSISLYRDDGDFDGCENSDTPTM